MAMWCGTTGDADMEMFKPWGLERVMHCYVPAKVGERPGN